MCDLTHLSSAISPVATTYRCRRPVWGHGNYSRAVMTRTPPRWPAFREHLERTSSESDLMTHIEHFTYLTHLKRELHTYSTAYIYIYIYIYIYTYIYIYIYIYIYVVCVYRAASRAPVQCKYGKHAGHLQKRLLCRLVSKSRHSCSL